jgi:hypothetical protein
MAAPTTDIQGIAPAMPAFTISTTPTPTNRANRITKLKVTTHAVMQTFRMKRSRRLSVSIRAQASAVEEEPDLLIGNLTRVIYHFATGVATAYQFG